MFKRTMWSVGLLLMACFAQAQPVTPVDLEELTEADDVSAYNELAMDCADYLLENSPARENERRLAGAYFFAWLTKSSDVSARLSEPMLMYGEGNEDLMLIYMAGFAKSAMEDPSHKDDSTSCVEDGFIAVYEYYLDHENHFDETDEIEALIEATESDEAFAAWVEAAMEE
ncbi:MAG: hypothetical protein HWD92_05815 [Flavobacteriia bacterium]|nr:hypothetical protein [Flavobacteriia bacterium]